MTTPPRPTPRVRPAAAASTLDLPAVSFFGRTLDEYGRFFALDPSALRGRAVLDVAAGPSSFTAEARRRGVDAVAVDPLYDRPHAELAARVRDDYARMFEQIREKRRLFRFKTFPTFDAAETDRRAAAARFLADYEGNGRHGRYVRASLPLLPFLDGAFDLVLCAHLLFIYATRFDFAWHVTACAELARVSHGEVRIHPLVGPGGKPYAELDRLRGELGALGITTEVRKVNYEFFVGSSSMLVLNPQTT
ncbi:class I SAM-dependent methyltransferase [Lacunisphaera limnophila]|uniref:class I SAM-dependent methyltransferase n=1 Tax=Lacunisphaera limnophila TaxID=1838286 RepID=UPI0008598D38|nr:class I SAM-dependent methyltransferase [Lacunisphaera limnophila]